MTRKSWLSWVIDFWLNTRGEFPHMHAYVDSHATYFVRCEVRVPRQITETLAWPGRGDNTGALQDFVVTQWGLLQEVGGNQSAPPVELAHEESVIIHVAINCDRVATSEGQLHLRIFRLINVLTHTLANEIYAFI